MLKETWCLSKVRSAGVMYSKGFKVSFNQLFFFFLSFFLRMLAAIILVKTVVPVNQDLPRSDIDVFANQVGRVTTVHMVGYNSRGGP